MRVQGIVAVIVAVGLGAGAPDGAAAQGAGGACWAPPVVGEVIDPFREPGCPWCPGNRGIEYRVGVGTRVRAAASGTVVFAGSVVGVRYVVVELPTGWRLTYGRLSSTALGEGQRVVAGSEVGRADREFYFGLRIGESYVDPAPYLGELVGRRRLVPLDGTPARPSPTVACRRTGGVVVGAR